MATITTRDGTRIFYKDWGPKDGQPIVFSHGWPLSADAWDAQMVFFANEGFRTIAAAEPGRVRLIDAAGTPDEVFARVLAVLRAAGLPAGTVGE